MVSLSADGVPARSNEISIFSRKLSKIGQDVHFKPVLVQKHNLATRALRTGDQHPNRQAGFSRPPSTATSPRTPQERSLSWKAHLRALDTSAVVVTRRRSLRFRIHHVRLRDQRRAAPARTDEAGMLCGRAGRVICGTGHTRDAASCPSRSPALAHDRRD